MFPVSLLSRYTPRGTAHRGRMKREISKWRLVKAHRTSGCCDVFPIMRAGFGVRLMLSDHLIPDLAPGHTAEDAMRDMGAKNRRATRLRGRVGQDHGLLWGVWRFATCRRLRQFT